MFSRFLLAAALLGLASCLTCKYCVRGNNACISTISFDNYLTLVTILSSQDNTKADKKCSDNQYEDRVAVTPCRIYKILLWAI